MHSALAGFFDEHDRPKHASKADAIAANRPLLQMAGRVQRQLAEYRALLLDAEHAPDLPDAFRSRLESMHQGLNGADKILHDYQKAGRDLTRTMAQLEKDFNDAKDDLK